MKKENKKRVLEKIKKLKEEKNKYKYLVLELKNKKNNLTFVEFRKELVYQNMKGGFLASVPFYLVHKNMINKVNLNSFIYYGEFSGILIYKHDSEKTGKVFF